MLFFIFYKLLERNKNKTQMITSICGDQITNLPEIVSIIEKHSVKQALIKYRGKIINSFIGINTLMKKVTDKFNTVSIREVLKRVLNV